MYVSLAAGVVMALWMRDTPGRAAIVVPALAVLFLVPRLELPLWHDSVARPAFFTDGLYRDCVEPNENVFIAPYTSGEPLLWQVEADFHFRFAGGAVRPGLPEPFEPIKAVWEIYFDDATPGSPDMEAFFSQKGVTRALIEESQNYRWTGPLERRGAPSTVGGIVVYPGCNG
jgi:hypothetical protein